MVVVFHSFPSTKHLQWHFVYVPRNGSAKPTSSYLPDDMPSILFLYSCSQVALSNSQRIASSERISQINSIDGIKFNSWSSGEYKNKNSKALVFCGSGHFWSASVTNLLGGSGCPYCAKYGYQLDKKGYLYALRSECGRYLKVGISNTPSRRHKQLEKTTPFKFNLVEQMSGDGVKIAELEKYFHGKYERAGFTGFDGCTEWLICTDELLKEIIEMGR